MKLWFGILFVTLLIIGAFALAGQLIAWFFSLPSWAQVVVGILFFVTFMWAMITVSKSDAVEKAYRHDE